MHSDFSLDTALISTSKYSYSTHLHARTINIVEGKGFSVCVCVCVLFYSHSFWTSSSLDVPAGVTQEEDHTGIFI